MGAAYLETSVSNRPGKPAAWQKWAPIGYHNRQRGQRLQGRIVGGAGRYSPARFTPKLFLLALMVDLNLLVVVDPRG